MVKRALGCAVVFAAAAAMVPLDWIRTTVDPCTKDHCEPVVTSTSGLDDVGWLPMVLAILGAIAAAEIARRDTSGTTSSKRLLAVVSLVAGVLGLIGAAWAMLVNLFSLGIDLHTPFVVFTAASLIGSILALLLIVRPAIPDVDLATLKSQRHVDLSLRT